MKKLFVILFSFLSLQINATNYYVATTGLDSHAGTFASPWLTFQHSVTVAIAGDTVFFRGGIYPITADINHGRSGTANHPICFFNYPTEIPIFDCQTKVPSSAYTFGIRIDGYNYIKYKGLIFENLRQTYANYVVVSYSCQDAKGIYYENCVAHNIGGPGYKTYNCDSIFYTNCDAYYCADSLTNPLPGNGGVGFSMVSAEVTPRSGPIVYYGCRSWNCADDGFDGNYCGLVTYDKCWSWGNGYLTGGAGNGFKFGWLALDIDPKSRIITNCLSAYNKFCGFSENCDGYTRMNISIYNNISYKNAYGYRSWSYTSHSENQNYYINNIGYNNTSLNFYKEIAAFDTYNSWNTPPNVTISDADFVSVDSTGISDARQVDGSLPVINFLKLASTSNTIDAGVYVGLPFYGANPDLGYDEYLFPPSYSGKVLLKNGVNLMKSGNVLLIINK